MIKKITNNIRETKLITHLWVYFDNVFKEEEIDYMCNYFSNKGTQKATIVKPISDQTVDLTTRISNVAFHYRKEETGWVFDKFNSVIEEANQHFWNFDLHGYEFFQYTEYDGNEKGKYEYHMDLITGKTSDVDYFLTRKLSLIMMLNTPNVDFKGGDFMINQQDESNAIKIPFVKGRIILFPSFLIHKVAPVTKGIRKTLVTWILGPKFK